MNYCILFHINIRQLILIEYILKCKKTELLLIDLDFDHIF